MKKIFTSFILLCFFIGSLTVQAQAPRTTIFEEFTSATCPPCAATNPIFKKFLEPYGNKVINVAFQCNIPTTGDPMYASNTTEVNTRMTYYGINSAPSCRMDGNAYSGHPLNVTSSIVDTRLAKTSPIEVNVNHLVILGANGAKDSMDITIEIKNVSSSNFNNTNYVLQTAIIERLIKFPKQAATNGETEFHNVMRKMIPSATGTKILDTIAAGASKLIKFRAAVPAYIYSYNELGVVAYVQNNTASSKEVIQTGISEPMPINNGLYYDLAMTSGKVGGRADDCDNTITYEVEIQNLSTGTDTIKSIDLVPVVAGANKTKSTWTGILLPGGKTTHKISTTLTFGIVSYNVFIDKINAGAIKDINIVNNFQGQTVFTTYNSSVQGTTLKQGFETGTGTAAPANTYYLSNGLRIFRADSVAGNNFPYPMGGFGKSRYSTFFAFSDGGVAGASATCVFDKLDLTSSKSTKLKWNYAYAVIDDNSNDKMEVEVSKDCGSNWISVFENDGTNMKTCDPDVVNSHIPGFFLPLPTEWKEESVDLSKYDGEAELLIRFTGTAGNGWAYFLDDVNVNSATSTNDPGILKSMIVSPNPTTEFVNIKINSTENANAIISLNDLNGKKVSSLSKNIIVGQNQFNIPVGQISGVYILEVKTEKGIRTEKVSIF